MKLVKTEQAIGHVICHDMTQIIPGVTKDAVFRKGHVVTEEDVPILLSMGKEHLYVWEKDETKYHEDEAAEILKEICCNEHMTASEIKEGKVELIASTAGVFKVDRAKLHALNSLGEIIIATWHDNSPVKKGQKVAGARIIPLVIPKAKMLLAKEIAGDKPILSILPFRRFRAGVVITGGEVFHGRIKDAFAPVIREKLAEYGVEIVGEAISDDKQDMIAGLIREFLDQGANLIICTGGMSVDPDDITPAAIRDVGAEIISYGAPVLPGAMFLLAYMPTGVPVLGLPGCVMYSKRTIFDLVLPRVIAGEWLTFQDISQLGIGGLCQDCGDCTFPNCGFGK